MKKLGGDLRDRSPCNVNYRTERAWGKFHQHKASLTNKAISLKLRLKLFEAVVTPPALYSLSTTALTAHQRTRVSSVRNSMLRKIVGLTSIPQRAGKRPGEGASEKYTLLSLFTRSQIGLWRKTTPRGASLQKSPRETHSRGQL